MPRVTAEGFSLDGGIREIHRGTITISAANEEFPLAQLIAQRADEQGDHLAAAELAATIRAICSTREKMR